MKNLSILFIALGLFYSCGNESSEDSTNDSGTELDSLNTIDSAEVELSYNSIEDYIGILSRADLYEKFDATALVDGESWYAEGTVKFEHTVLTNPENGHVVKYVWEEENTSELGSIEFVYFVYNADFDLQGTQKIESSTGIYTGMPLQDLVKWNGSPFKFSGFGWDYAGGIFAEEGGKIESSPFGMRLDVDYDGMEGEQYNGLFGDMELSTDAKEVKGAPIFLGIITYWPQD